MPTYEYRCPDGHSFERFAKMSEAASELECPTCGKLAARQLSGGAGLVFKGSGFYLTDYGKNAHRKQGSDPAASGASKDGESSAGEAKSGDKGTDKGPDKSADGKASESKPTESKSAESSAATPKAAEKSGSATDSKSSANKKPDK